MKEVHASVIDIFKDNIILFIQEEDIQKREASIKILVKPDGYSLKAKKIYFSTICLQMVLKYKVIYN